MTSHRILWYLKKAIFGVKTISGFALIFAIAIIASGGVAQAGTLTPSASPAATMYTASNIYTRLTTNATSSEAGHVFTPGAAPASSMYTMKQIYEAIPTIVAGTVKSGTTYLGVAGTLVPSGGNAGAANVLSGQTFYGTGQSDWTLQSGTMTNVGAQVITPSTTNLAITQGYHDGTGYVVGDTDLVAGNIKSGVTLFGISGSFSGAGAGLLYGDNDPAKVLTTAASSGTYDATNLIAGNVRNGVSYGAGQTGTFTGDLAYGDNSAAQVLTTASSSGTYNATNLTTATVKLGTSFGVGLTGALIPSGGNAAAGQVLSGQTFFGNGQSDWVLQTGTMTNIGQQIITPSTTSLSITQGYHDGSGYTIGDADLIASNIKSGVNLFGVSGSYTGAGGLTYGDDNPIYVLTTASSSGTYNATNLNTSTVKLGTSFGVGLTGALIPSGGNAATGRSGEYRPATTADLVRCGGMRARVS